MRVDCISLNTTKLWVFHIIPMEIKRAFQNVRMTTASDFPNELHEYSCKWETNHAATNKTDFNYTHLHQHEHECRILLFFSLSTASSAAAAIVVQGKLNDVSATFLWPKLRVKEKRVRSIKWVRKLLGKLVNMRNERSEKELKREKKEMKSFP